MAIDKNVVEHVAHLARLDLKEDEKNNLQGELGAILHAANKLQEIDTQGIPPTAHILPLHNVLRKDQPWQPWPQGEILKNSPEKENGYFKVPRIVEQEDS